jgi:4a-hydroxytetrahydrobiopterin dehydratase
MHRRKLILGLAVVGIVGTRVNSNSSESKLIAQELAKLVAQGWKVIEGKKLQKEFKFKDFVEAFGFMTEVAIACAKMDRHPEWFNRYNLVVINLTTDTIGISRLDIDLATKINTFTNTV